MSNSFTEKNIEVTIKLATGTFGEIQADQVTLSNFRIFADATAPTGEMMGALQLRVFGLSLSMMNRLTMIGQFGQQGEKNTILVAAGDSTKMSTIFEGSIWQAWAEFSNNEAIFNIIAYIGMDLQLKPANASSYPQSAKVSDIMQQLATSANLAFENNGVDIQLYNPYFKGTVRQQILSCARAAPCNQKIELSKLTIWPKGGYLESSSGVPLIASYTGMIGYPVFSSQGMIVRSQFIPELQLGGQIKVESSLKMANGYFTVYGLKHSLSCQAPNGPWMTTITCFPQQ